MGVHHTDAGIGIGRERIAAVEAGPAEPEQASTRQGDQQRVRVEALAVTRKTRADDGSSREARESGSTTM